jgi:hypothetical protein
MKGMDRMWWKVLFVVVVVLAAVAVGALLFGVRRWKSEVRALHAAMDTARSPVAHDVPVDIYPELDVC